MPTRNRWGIALAGVFLQIALGAVYAWSVFRDPLMRQFHWTISEVTLTFTIAIFVLGVASFFGGLWLNAGLRAQRSIACVAMVGAVAAFIYQHFGRNFGDLARIAAVPNAGGNALGRVFWAWVSDLATAQDGVPDYVPDSGCAVLALSQPARRLLSADRDVRYFDVVRGRISNDAGVYGRLFRPTQCGTIYGLMLTAWGFASVFGPLLIAHLRQTTGKYGGALHIIAIVLLISAILPFIVRPPKAA